MKNGHIPLGTTTVTPQTQRPDFLRDYPSATVAVANPPYYSYSFGPVSIYGREFFGHITFVQNRLWKVGLTADTDSWFGENLEDEKVKNDAWLKQSFGILFDVTTYAWGRISSHADHKTGSASIAILYNDRNESGT